MRPSPASTRRSRDCGAGTGVGQAGLPWGNWVAESRGAWRAVTRFPLTVGQHVARAAPGPGRTPRWARQTYPAGLIEGHLLAVRAKTTRPGNGRRGLRAVGFDGTGRA